MSRFFTTGARLLGVSGFTGSTYRRRIQKVREVARRCALAEDVDEREAELIAQHVQGEAHLRLVDRPTLLDDDQELERFVRGCVGNTYRMMARERARERRRGREFEASREANPQGSVDPDVRLRENEAEDVKRRIDARLSAAQREARMLREEKFSYAEIADRTGNTVAGVKNLLYRSATIAIEECEAAGIPVPAWVRHGKRTGARSAGSAPGDEKASGDWGDTASSNDGGAR